MTAWVYLRIVNKLWMFHSDSSCFICTFVTYTETNAAVLFSFFLCV